MTEHRNKEEAPAGTRRDRQKRETRAAIQKAAHSLFGSQGFEATTIRAIASKAGVGVGTVHLHFRDKESLLVECLIDDLTENDRQAWGTMPEDASIRDQLLHLVREAYLGWTRQPSLSRVILRQMVLSRRSELDRLRALDADVARRLTGLMRAAQARGEIRSDADPALATKAIFAFYLTSSLNWLGNLEGRGPQELDGQPASALTEGTLGILMDEAKGFLDLLFSGIGMEGEKEE
jgi:AcrR family transcriptional regulator